MDTVTSLADPKRLDSDTDTRIRKKLHTNFSRNSLVSHNKFKFIPYRPCPSINFIL